MSGRSERITPAVLRDWGLPDPGGSKKSRGQVMLVGGSRQSPGALLLSSEAALRVGAGRAAAVVPAEIETGFGLAMPELGVHPLPAAGEAFEEATASALAAADAVLLGPGFADPDSTRAALRAVADAGVGCLVLDAFALGVLDSIPRSELPDDLVINANQEEAEILLGRDASEDRVADVREIAARFDAVVHCYGVVADPDGTAWSVPSGGPGLGTAGSGDVLAGAIAGFAARGVGSARAAVWGSWVHARAGDRLTERIGLGFLARELPREFPGIVADALR